MTTAAWIIAGVVALIVAAIAIEAYVKRNKRRILSQTQPTPPQANPEKVALGQDVKEQNLVEQASANTQKLKKANTGSSADT